MAPLKTPAEKLPLTVRKNVRDEWEAKRPGYESDISTALGTAWTIETNVNLIYVYADDSYKDRIGSVLTWYMDALVYNIKGFVNVFGEDGKGEINTVCSKHKIVFGPQDTTQFTYGGLDVKDGTLRLVFAENYLGTNVSDVSAGISKALKDAPAAPGASAFNIDARNSVREKYDPNVEEVRSSIAALVNMPNLKLNPNFEHNASMLAKTADQHSSWDMQIGAATLAYFSGLEGQLQSAGFKGDDMLQEGFQEGVDKGEICFRIVDKLTKGTYNEVVIENGVLYIQTTPTYWYTNVGDAGSRLMDIL